MGNFIVLAVVVLLVAYGVRSIYKKQKEGSCGCGCSSCDSGHCSSHTHE